MTAPALPFRLRRLRARANLHEDKGKGAWFIHYLTLDIYYLVLDIYYLKGDEDNGS
jgi:hypothetical protein